MEQRTVFLTAIKRAFAVSVEKSSLQNSSSTMSAFTKFALDWSSNSTKLTPPRSSRPMSMCASRMRCASSGILAARRRASSDTRWRTLGKDGTFGRSSRALSGGRLGQRPTQPTYTRLTEAIGRACRAVHRTHRSIG